MDPVFALFALSASTFIITKLGGFDEKTNNRLDILSLLMAVSAFVVVYFT